MRADRRAQKTYHIKKITLGFAAPVTGRPRFFISFIAFMDFIAGAGAAAAAASSGAPPAASSSSETYSCPKSNSSIPFRNQLKIRKDFVNIIDSVELFVIVVNNEQVKEFKFVNSNI